MEKPFEIDYRGFSPNERQISLIRQKAKEFERLFGRIAAGRLVISAPSARHRSGGQFDVNIRLRLPAGREVDISRTSNIDERYANFEFAVNDAFKRAKRHLQKQVEKLEGEVKSHEGQPTGIISKLYDDHGFILGAEGLEVYFHRNSVLDGAFAKLKVGTRISFSEVQGDKGPQASTVRLMGGQKLK